MRHSLTLLRLNLYSALFDQPSLANHHITTISDSRWPLASDLTARSGNLSAANASPHSTHCILQFYVGHTVIGTHTRTTRQVN